MQSRAWARVQCSVVMILLGRVYDGLRVDLQAVNRKLVRRSESILKRLTGCRGAQACEALRQANGNVKLAVLLLHGCDLKEATSVLDRAGGQLRAALAAIGKPGLRSRGSEGPDPDGGAGYIVTLPPSVVRSHLRQSFPKGQK